MVERIIGLGMDVVEIKRVRQLWDEHRERFLEKIFHENEKNYALNQADPVISFAARFAAKEAASKAFGTGIGAELGWLDMEVVRKANERPELVLHGKGVELAEKRGIHRILLTLTHTNEYAAATVILIAS